MTKFATLPPRLDCDPRRGGSWVTSQLAPHGWWTTKNPAGAGWSMSVKEKIDYIEVVLVLANIFLAVFYIGKLSLWW